MNRDTWTDIQSIFHDALELSESERDAYVEAAANGDEEVLREVRAYLAADRSASQLLDEPILELNTELFAEGPVETLLTGREIAGYQIGRRLGSGGMGDVYYADDLSLNRPVALKFLSAEFHCDDNAKAHLKREAKSLSVLKHPNICDVFTYVDAGEHQFMVMEYVEGESLANLIADQRLFPVTTDNVGLQIVSAIAAAHEQKIIHCDIKPGNMIVAKNGTTKVLDFGLAKVVHDQSRPDLPSEQITQAAKSVQIGTVAYMSPEQHEGRELDYRSDVFSLGILLYELHLGKNPFERSDAQKTKEAILDGNVTFASQTGESVRPALKRVLTKCLEVDPSRRYSDAAKLKWDLEHLQRSWLAAITWKVGAPALALLTVFAIVSAVFYFGNEPERSVAIMPFLNETADPELDYLSDGIAENLVDRMQRASGFIIVPYTKLTGVLSQNVNVAQIGKSLNANLVVTGRIFKNDGNLVVEAKLIETRDGSVARTSLIDLKTEDIQTAENVMLKKLFEDLDVWTLEPLENGGYTPGKTKIPEAHRQYLIGRGHWRKRDRTNIDLAIGAYQRAIDLDPTFARAWAGMAECWVLMSSVAYGSITPKESFDRARAAARHALEIEPANAEARTVMGVVLTKHDWKWQEAEVEYRQAITDDPNYGAAYYWLSGLLGIMGRNEESIAAAEKAKELEPYSPLVEYNLARTYYFARQYDKSLEILNRGGSTQVEEEKIQYLTALNYIQNGNTDEAIKRLEAISAKNKMLAVAALGHAQAKVGRRREATKLIEELKASAKGSYVPAQEIAIIYIGMNETDKAFEYLHAAYREKYGSLSALRVEPLFDGVRDDARFRYLLVQMGLN